MTQTEEHAVYSVDGTRISYFTVGSGPAVLIVGGTLRRANDYLPLANALSRDFQVHVIERRGRGGSGPQGTSYGIEREVEDVRAVLEQTQTPRLFGHSFGGLVALQVAAGDPRLTQVAAYEPAVSMAGSIPTTWLPDYEQLLRRGDRRGAFANLVRGSGHAPAALSRMPFRCTRLALAVVVRGERCGQMASLLEQSALEHAEVQQLDGQLLRYGSVTAQVVLMAGERSPASVSASFPDLERLIPDCNCLTIPGLSHTAPDEGAPSEVAAHLRAVFARRPATWC